jgi:hypothetical protein
VRPSGGRQLRWVGNVDGPAYPNHMRQCPETGRNRMWFVAPRSGEDAVAELAEQGELPGRKLAGEWRFAREAVVDWLAAR